MKTFVLVSDVVKHRCTISLKHGTTDWNLQFLSKHLVLLDGKGRVNSKRGTDSDLSRVLNGSLT